MESGTKMDDKTDLPPESQIVWKALQKLNITHEFLFFEPEQTRTSRKAAEAIGCKLSQICKSIALITENGTPLIVLTAGHNRINLGKLSELIGENLRLMTPREVKEHTGFNVGGVPPVGHVTKIKTYMDQDLLHHGTVYAAGGTANSLIELNPQELQKSINAIVISVK